MRHLFVRLLTKGAFGMVLVSTMFQGIANANGAGAKFNSPSAQSNRKSLNGPTGWLPIDRRCRWNWNIMMICPTGESTRGVQRTVEGLLINLRNLLVMDLEGPMLMQEPDRLVDSLVCATSAFFQECFAFPST